MQQKLQQLLQQFQRRDNSPTQQLQQPQQEPLDSPEQFYQKNNSNWTEARLLASQQQEICIRQEYGNESLIIDDAFDNIQLAESTNQGWSSSVSTSELRQRNSHNSTMSEASSIQFARGGNKPMPRYGYNPFATSLHWSWILSIFLVSIAVTLIVYRLDTIDVEDKKVHIKMQRPFLDDFANSTATLMNDMADVDLPPSNTVMEGTVLYRRFANIIENSPGFKNNGASIATNLRQFSNKIMDAGQAFEDMYRYGDLVFWMLDKQINQILTKLNPGLFDQIFSKDDESFFVERIQDMIRVVDSFKLKVTTASKAIRDAEGIRDQTELGLVKGINEEAEKFIEQGPMIGEYRLKLISDHLYTVVNEEENKIDVENARNHLEQAHDILNMIYKSAEGLHQIIKILNNYRSRLFDVQAELYTRAKVSQNDLERLQKVLENLKECHSKFIKKDEIADSSNYAFY